MRFHKRELITLLLLFLLIVAAACSAKPGAGGSQATVYKIGFVAAVTGPASTLGEPEGEVAAMLQKQLDAAGGIKGPDGVLHPVKIIVQDSEGSGDVAVPIAKKLIDDEGVVAIIGDTTSPVSMALIPIVQEAQVPMVSMASSSAIVEPVAERQWVFKSAQSNRHTAPWQVRYVKALGITKIANFYVNNAYGEDGRDGIRAAAAQEGVEIVLEDSFGATDTDMTAQLTKLKASGAEALLVTATPPAASILTKQFHEMGLDIPLVHNHGIGMASFITLSTPEAAEGVVFPMGKLVAASALPDSDPQKQVLLDFMAAYEKETGKKPSTFAGHAWDATQLVLKGLETFPNGLSLSEQRAKLRDAIEATQGFVGTAGTFNLSAQDHVGLSSDDIVMARITGGQWEYFPPDKW